MYINKLRGSIMRLFYTSLVLCLSLLSTQLPAADFGWTAGFNAKVESSGNLYLNKMTIRFGVSSGDVQRVHKLTKDPAHAYLIFRLAEISGKNFSVVLQTYQNHKNQGWGVMAKNLGIKPGSPAFKQLKQSDDLFSISIGGQSNSGKGSPNNKKKK